MIFPKSGKEMRKMVVILGVFSWILVGCEKKSAEEMKILKEGHTFVVDDRDNSLKHDLRCKCWKENAEKGWVLI